MGLTRLVMRIATVVLLVGSSAACGGASASNPGASVLGREFQSKAASVCRDVLAQKQAQGEFPYPNFNPTEPDLSKLPSIALIEKKTAQIYKSWLHRLQALGAPPSGRSLWSELVDAVSANGRIIADQQMAAANRDGAKFTQDYYDGTAAQHNVERAANAAGVPGCAEAAAA